MCSYALRWRAEEANPRAAARRRDGTWRSSLRSKLLAAAVLAAAVASCDGAPAPATQWWTTCGDPVCGGYTGPFDGVPLCVDETPGEACTDPGAECDPQDDCNARVRCADTDPTADGCPISLAAYKTDLQYLDHDGLDAAADRALRTRLATWRYRWDPAAARPHLGFVIDDDPTSPAVAEDGRHVDVYGYASLALAAVQRQQAEIDALRAEVASLRSTCGR